MKTYGEIMQWLKGLTRAGREAKQKARVEEMFQMNNSLVNIKNGGLYRVYEVGTGEARLVDNHGELVTASWYNCEGGFAPQMVRNWIQAAA